MIASKHVVAADLFCGAGGTSLGLLDACSRLGRKARLTAVNHWPRAVPPGLARALVLAVLSGEADVSRYF